MEPETSMKHNPFLIISLGLMRVIGFRAFPLATTIASFLNLAILMHMLPRKVGAFQLSLLVDYFTRLVLAAMCGGFLGLLLSRLLTGALGIAFFAQTLNILISGSTALVVCYIVCMLLGVTEARDYLKRFLKK